MAVPKSRWYDSDAAASYQVAATLHNSAKPYQNQFDLLKYKVRVVFMLDFSGHVVSASAPQPTIVGRQVEGAEPCVRRQWCRRAAEKSREKSALLQP